ncbi:hypothetical protein H5T89_06620 [bacterium]|nr:hypothetical protein [bacterium]
MSKVYVLFWFDVEDFISPQSDNALKGIIDILDSYKIKGTFKLVGEKIRVLKRRNRDDIINSLKRHDIGYHTNLHSVHPTVAEYLKDLDWEEGIEEFERRERPGFEEIVNTFNVIPSCYGQPGSSWAPQVYPVLKKWEIPVYLDEAEHIGFNQKPFWYCGILNVLRLRENTTRFDLNLGDEGVKIGINNFNSIARRLLDEGGGVISIWYHPCEFATYEFWDAVNFSRGKNPNRVNWVMPRIKPYQEMKKGLELFSNYVAYISSHPDVQIITAKEIYNIYSDRSKDKTFSIIEIVYLAREVGSSVSYYRMNNIFLSPAEIFYLVLSLLANIEDIESHQIAEKEFNLHPIIYGPTKRVNSELSFCDQKDFLSACRWVLEFINKNNRIPDAIKIEDKNVSPLDFFATANILISYLFANSQDELTIREKLPERIKLVKGNLTLENQVKEEGIWNWIIFPEEFNAPNIIELAKLQTWTLKPAESNN